MKGRIHYERRLHQLMLKEEEKEWKKSAASNIAAALAASSAVQATAPAGANALLPSQPPAPASAPASPHPPRALSMDAAVDRGVRGNGAANATDANGIFQMDRSPSMDITGLAEQDFRQAPPPSSRDLPPLQPHHQRHYSNGHLSGGSSRSSSMSDLPSAAKLILAPKPIRKQDTRPQVTIQHYGHLNYWLVTIRCKDRHKLFFDTVCTLADLNYDIYHATIDCEGESGARGDPVRLLLVLLLLALVLLLGIYPVCKPAGQRLRPFAAAAST